MHGIAIDFSMTHGLSILLQVENTTTTEICAWYIDASVHSCSPQSLPSSLVLPMLLWFRKQENAQSGLRLSCLGLTNSVCPVHIVHAPTSSMCIWELSPCLYFWSDYLISVYRCSTLDPEQNIDFYPVAFWQ